MRTIALHKGHVLEFETRFMCVCGEWDAVSTLVTTLPEPDSDGDFPMGNEVIIFADDIFTLSERVSQKALNEAIHL